MSNIDYKAEMMRLSILYSRFSMSTKCYDDMHSTILRRSKRNKLREDPTTTLRKPMMGSGKENRNEMRALPLPRQFPISKERAWALGVWFRGLHQYRISAVFDKMVELFKMRA